MNAINTASLAAQDSRSVLEFRRAAMANGWAPIPLLTSSKKPAHAGWTTEPIQIGPPHRSSLNTGIRCTGLRVIDIDVDDGPAVVRIVRLALDHLGSGFLARRRNGSPRLALIYRAAAGQPGKRDVSGEVGKVEVLGDGQQLAVHGQHPVGGQWYFQGDGPDVRPLASVASITEAQLESFLDACRPALGALPRQAPRPARSGVSALLAAHDAAFANGAAITHAVAPLHDTGEFSGGLGWFDKLDPAEKDAAIRDTLEALDPDCTYHEWRNALWACRDAERLGAASAPAIAEAWSRRGSKWDPAAFDSVWNSSGHGIGVGTLLRHAPEWVRSGAPPYTPAPSALPAPLPVGALWPVPPKRRWLYGHDLLRGAVTVIGAPPAGGKTALMVGMAAASALGRGILGCWVHSPLNVTILSLEEPREEVDRRLFAFGTRHAITPADLGGRLSIVTADGFPYRLTQAAAKGVSVNPEAVAALRTIVQSCDVVLIDHLARLNGGDENTASHMDPIFAALNSIAGEFGCAIGVAHHLRKGTLLGVGQAEGLRGSSATEGGARIVLGLSFMTADEAKRWAYPKPRRGSTSVFQTPRRTTPPSGRHAGSSWSASNCRTPIQLLATHRVTASQPSKRGHHARPRSRSHPRCSAPCST